MAVHYFHCTNGIDLVIDPDGHETQNSDENSSRAQAVACQLMRSLPAYDEWSNWAVLQFEVNGIFEAYEAAF